MTPGRRLGGWCNPAKLPKGPNGRALCRWCSEEVPKGRRSFCCKDCVHEHKIRSDPGYAAAMVAKRDRGVCALCGVDCEAVARTVKEVWSSFEGPPPLRVDNGKRFGTRSHVLDVARARALEVLGFPGWASGRSRLWDMDHIVPVIEGGGSCGLENLRTLCIPCHKGETAELAARRARARRPQQELDL